MKTFIKTVALVSVTAALNVNAAIDLEATNETAFQIGGQIEEVCKVTHSTNTLTSSIDLSSSQAQNIASVEIWCNNGQSSTSTTYTSSNAGKLINADHTGQDIAYLLDISNASNGTGLDLSSPQTIAQTSGFGTSGSTEVSTVSIRPTVDGYEYAGTYSDTITVTVAVN